MQPIVDNAEILVNNTFYLLQIYLFAKEPAIIMRIKRTPWDRGIRHMYAAAYLGKNL